MIGRRAILGGIISLLTGVLPVNQANGQVVFYEDFEGYSMAQWLCEQSDVWRTWSGETGGMEDAPLSFAFPDTNTALEIRGSLLQQPQATTDIVLPLGDRQEGIYSVSFDLYIPDSGGAYYNFQHFAAPGTEWAFEFTVDQGGIINGTTQAILKIGGKRAGVDIRRGKWVTLEHLIDLDNDVIWLLIDTWYAHHWKFSSQASKAAGTRQLGGINFYPLDQRDIFYVDNVKVERLFTNDRVYTPINGDFEESAAGLRAQPFGWRPVLMEDIHSSSTNPDDSLVDVLSARPLSRGSDRYGNAWSGEQFVAGAHHQDAGGHVTQSGISQYLRGLQAGEWYTLNFYQSVIQDSQNQDPSGSWQVLLNDSVIGVSEVASLPAAQPKGELQWTNQEMTFRANGSGNQLKFIPLDDDDNIREEDREGLIMGLDRVTVWPLLTAVREVPPTRSVEYYPNPTVDRLYVNQDGTLKARDLQVYNLQGRRVALPPIASLPDKFVVDVSGLSQGLYMLSFGRGSRSSGLFYKR